MIIPFLDLSSAHRELKDELNAAISASVESCRYVLGPNVEGFEEEFAEYCGVRHAVGVGSGLSALYLVLRAWGIGVGDEVIVPSFTFVATWLAVTLCGAQPVPVEPNVNTCNIDPGLIEGAISPHTKAIVPVHLYGRPAEMEKIMEIGERHRIPILEDAAQAHGAYYGDRRAGSLGDAAAWSFYPGKNLGALGDGGAITTDDASLALQLRALRNYGSEVKYVHDVAGGVNSRLDDIQAAVLRVKLRHLEEWNQRRRDVAATYFAALENSGLVLPPRDDIARSAWHLYVIRSHRRSEIAQGLSERGIESLIHYPIPPHLQKGYAHLGYNRGSFPVAEELSAGVLSLPIGPHLGRRNAVEIGRRVRELALLSGR